MNNESESHFDFEKGMERLEAIISQFDEGGLTLDQMEKMFAEGMELINHCSKRLDGVEARITQLINGHESEWPELSDQEKV